MSDTVAKSASSVASLLERMESRRDTPALAIGKSEISTGHLLAAMSAWEADIVAAGIAPGDICAFEGEYGVESISLILALLKLKTVLVPFSLGVREERGRLSSLARVKWFIDPLTREVVRQDELEGDDHPLIEDLRAQEHPGLIVFTSGSSGTPKAILHDVERVASKFIKPRKSWRMLLMLLIDHFGGVNTLLACLFDGGVGICVGNRSPEAVCRAVSDGRAELLPTTPTFLGVLIGSGLWRKYDLSSIRLITYGAEPMPPATLRRVREVFPNAVLKQTYGLSELGVLRSSSPDPESLWIRIGGDGFETRVIDGELHVRSASSMLGYLNAPSPVSADGWMSTGDLVEENDSGLVRFIGRKTEVINVGGQKVFPLEVEDVILELEDVVEVAVHGVPHTLLGNAVVARVALQRPESTSEAVQKIRDHCRSRLQKYKVPIRFEIVDHSSLTTMRSKKARTRPMPKN
ncbi:ANL family adenylate-forming protein [Bradyrhizobium embrapense]|uniref:ANL family adenylate-forming protein n=1 Tax=Bradyrhizobium embrapense TaxID=630921 RepID=UPI00067CD19F|nr:fatty acid--CoA ligase family protein [Bradyrhizobium embrapense]